MSLSTSKQKKHATDVPLFIEDGAITQVDTAKSIGVYIDGTLTWTNHIKIIATKIAKNIGVILRISHVISPKLRLNMYHTMASPYIWPTLEYCMGIQLKIANSVLYYPAKKVIGIIEGES